MSATEEPVDVVAPVVASDGDDDVDFVENEAETLAEAADLAADPDAALTPEQLRAKYANMDTAEDAAEEEPEQEEEVPEAQASSSSTPAAEGVDAMIVTLRTVMAGFNGDFEGLKIKDIWKAMRAEPHNIDKKDIKDHKPELIEIIQEVMAAAQGDDSESAEEEEEEVQVKKKRAKSKRKRKKATDEEFNNKEGFPKSASTPYFLFMAEKRPELKEQGQVGNLAKALGQLWREMSDEDKKQYFDRAKQDRLRLDAEVAELREQRPDVYERYMASKVRKKRKAPTGEKNNVTATESLAPRTRKKPAASQLLDIPEEERSTIDNALIALGRGKKRAKVEDEAEQSARLNQMAQFFVKKMEMAYAKDVEARKEGTVAINKLQMLREVETQCNKRLQQERLLDYHLLVVINKWLQPRKDSNMGREYLPNEKIRVALYRILHFLPVGEGRLESSGGLGHTIAQLAQHPQEKAEHKAQLKNLIRKWVRSAARVSTDYRSLAQGEFSRKAEIADRRAMDARRPGRAKNSVTKRASIPTTVTFDFAIRPVSNISARASRSSEYEPMENSGRAKLERRLNKKNGRNLKAASVCNTGKSLNY